MARDGGGVRAGGGPALAETSEPLPTATISTAVGVSGSDKEPICLNGSDGGVADCDPAAPSPVPRALCRRPVRMLLIDNYDSYTYNLFQLMSMVNGAQPDVIHNDALPWPELRRRLLVEREWDGVVISPGPGTPEVASDVGVCGPLLAEAVSQDPTSPASLRFPPVFGVCLGMQALAHACGAVVSRAPEPVHGRLSAVGHVGSGGSRLFEGIPSSPDEERVGPSTPFRVVRYHSLAVDEATLPGCLRATAWTVGGTVAVETGASDEAAAKASEARAAAGAAAGGVASPPPPPPDRREEREEGEGEAEASRVLMALEHESLPLFGVQFHPESVATSFGDSLFANFREIVSEERRARLGTDEGDEEGGAGGATVVPSPVRGPATPGTKSETTATAATTPSPFPRPDQTSTLELAWEKVEGCLESVGGTESLFLRLFGGGGGGGAGAATATSSSSSSDPSLPSPSSLRLLDHGAADVWWLDSAAADRGRFSFMGGGPSGGHAGPLWSRATYRLDSDGRGGGGTLSVATRDGGVARARLGSSSVFDAVERQLVACARDPDPELPFGFQGGFVAVLGYELRSECGGGSFVAGGDGGGSDGKRKNAGFGGGSTGTPDAALVFADRLLAADHRTGDVYLVALYEKRRDAEGGREEREAASWVSDLAAAVRSLSGSSEPLPPPLASVAATGNPPSPPRFRVRRGKGSYLRDVASCLGALARGESYELCLTTRIETERDAPAPPALALYRTLREGNPAPYAAFVALGGDERAGGEDGPSPSVAVDGYCGPRICCSSPERFLRGDARGGLEARPIKGTARRVLSAPADGAAARAKAAADDAAVAAALAASEKDRAENLMIVDLLRNDLGRVCEPGSVSVPGLMEVETFATVHQLVSTVVGVARGMAEAGDGATGEASTCWSRAVAAEAASPPSSSPRVTSPVSAVRAAFPGGSMTGAPKVRSMSILDGLERGARGIYSGSLGFLSVTGAFDLNIVIRTAVVMPRAAAEAAADEVERTEEEGDGGGERLRVLPPAISIGAGGAVVLQSTPEGEYEEMLLKAGALLAAVGRVTSGPSSTPSPVVLVEGSDDEN